MTQEEKQLLLIDLCARLPYNDVRVTNGKRTIILSPSSNIEGIINRGYLPYLRPMSSMTESESFRFNRLEVYEWKIDEIIDFFNSKHLDYRGLIEKGLALEVPERKYKMNNKNEQIWLLFVKKI